MGVHASENAGRKTTGQKPIETFRSKAFREIRRRQIESRLVSKERIFADA